VRDGARGHGPPLVGKHVKKAHPSGHGGGGAKARRMQRRAEARLASEPAAGAPTSEQEPAAPAQACETLWHTTAS